VRPEESLTSESRTHAPTDAPRGRRSVLEWPFGPALLIALGLAVLALPSRLEGPPIWTISRGHALSLVDALGVVPLVMGFGWLHGGLWWRRARLERWASSRPAAAGRLTFAAGLGLGLLLASAFSAFFWWWAVGGALFLAANVAAIRVAGRRRRRHGAESV